MVELSEGCERAWMTQSSQSSTREDKTAITHLGEYRIDIALSTWPSRSYQYHGGKQFLGLLQAMYRYFAAPMVHCEMSTALPPFDTSVGVPSLFTLKFLPSGD